MLSRFLFLLFNFLLYSLYTLAQAYEPGLLVRANGDTLRGEVENGFWKEPPTFIRFRTAPGSASQLFQPRQLRAVQFTGGRYFRYEVLAIDHAAETRLSELSRGLHAYIHLDSLLAEVLLDGPVPLLRVVRPGATHYVVQRPGRPALTVCENQYLRQSDRGNWEVTDANNYRGQLEIYFLDCPAAAALAKTAPFTPEGLGTIVQAYNVACSADHRAVSSTLLAAGPRRETAFQAGVLAGGRLSHFKYGYGTFGGDCVDCQTYPFGGLYAELFQPSRTAALYGELSMSRFRFREHEYISSGLAPGTDVYNTVDYGGWLGTARLGVRFFFPLRDEQQLLLGFGLEHNEVWRPTVTTISGPASQQIIEYLEYAPPSFLPNVGVGWRSHRLTLGLDGQLYRSNDNDGRMSYVFGTNFALRANVSYRLGRNPDASKPAPAPAPRP